MALQYHYSLRQRLNQLFSNCHQVGSVSNVAASRLLTSYHSNPETSAAGQVQFYQDFINKLNTYFDEHVYQKKTWWQTCMYFIGWISQEESTYLAVIKQAKHYLKESQKCQNPLSWLDNIFWYPYKKFILMPLLYKKNIQTRLRNISHRTLLMITDVPDYLEGMSSVDSYADYSSDIQAYLKEMQLDGDSRKRFEEIDEQLLQCHQVENEYYFRRYQYTLFREWGRSYELEEQCVNDRVFEVLYRIANLDIGERALFKHGFRSKNGSHATVFEVFRTSAANVIFRFYNTGAGTQDIASWYTLGKNLLTKSNKSPVKITGKIPLEYLFTSDFITRLVTPTLHEAETVREGVDCMNAPILELYYNNKLYDDERNIRLQFMGSCGQSSIDAWVESQLSESEFIRFYCHRLKESIIKIKQLLQDEILTEELRGYCQRMHIAALVELAYLGTQLKEFRKQLENDISKSFRLLQTARVENAGMKGKEPKFLDMATIGDYCQGKLAEHRLKATFSDEDRIEITQAKSNKIDIYSTKKYKSTTYSLTLGLFGSVKMIPLSAEECKQNKLAKTKLCKQIIDLRQQEISCQHLFDDSEVQSSNENERRCIEQLVKKRTKKNSLHYSNLEINGSF